MVLGGVAALYLGLTSFGGEFVAGYLFAAILFHVAYLAIFKKPPT
tara:strand:- start:3203 stop:3337 length:135 start_codon:yes stop_codon:yes gene_type:complete